MRKLVSATVLAVFTLTLGASSVSVRRIRTLSPPNRTESYVRQAFTLEEMNCFSSDVRMSSGTMAFPAIARDPKAPPKKKRSRK